MADLIHHEIVDGVGHLTLQRPRAINALNVEMLTEAYEVLSDWLRHHAVERVELRGEGERGFCAGADVRALREALLAGEGWLQFLELEYALDMLIAQSPAPVTGYMHGITMGGGLGLTGHAARRVVDATSTLAMPETKIGFFPDCAILHQLSRAGAVGVHLALTSQTFTGGDAIRLDIADESADGELEAPLFGPEAAWIEECYTGDDVVEIVRRLEEHTAPEARAAAADIRARSPFSVLVTMRALRRAATLELSEVFGQDLRLAERMVPVDFAEGVRALLVDKDPQPRWRWARLEDVPETAVDEVFAY